MIRLNPDMMLGFYLISKNESPFLSIVVMLTVSKINNNKS